MARVSLPDIDKPRRGKKPVKRYAIYYYRMVDNNMIQQDTSGSTDVLENAYGRMSDHLQRSELNRYEYAMALLIDRRKGKVLRRATRIGTDIINKDL